jgi:hypothetical protein
MRSLLDSETGRGGDQKHENPKTGSLVQSSNLARETRFGIRPLFSAGVKGAEAGISMTPDSAPISPRCTDSPQSGVHTASKTLPQEYAYAMEVTLIGFKCLDH